ncbi:hypothetical protein ACNFNZ_17025 [Empedobacter brevis]
MKFIYYFILFTFFNCYLLKAQNNTTLISNPSSYQTGVPDISFPLFELQAAKDFNVNLELSYHPNSYRMGRNNGTTGRNWNLTGSIFSISIVNDVPVKTYDKDYKVQELYTIYKYNLNEESGFFKLVTKVNSTYFGDETFEIIRLSPNNSKIEFEIETGNFEHNLKTFTITDNKGYKYLFSNYDLIDRDRGYGGPYKSNFFINKIFDRSSKEIVSYNYIKNIKYDQSYGKTPIYIYNYLENITTTNGSIVLKYGENDSYDFFDKNYVKTITLLDSKGNAILNHELEMSNDNIDYYDLFNIYGDFQTKNINLRYLKELKKTNNSTTLEKTIFSYNSIKTPYTNLSPWWGEPKDFKAPFILRYDDPRKTTYGILNSVSLSNKKFIEYDFEPAKIESNFDKNSQEYINKIKDPFKFTDPEIEYIDSKYYDSEAEDIYFDTKVSRKYYINNLKSKDPYVRIYIQFQKYELYPYGHDHPQGIIAPEPYVAYKVKNSVSEKYQPIDDTSSFEQHISGKYYVVPNNGSAYIELLGAGNGSIIILEKLYKNPPYINDITSAHGGVIIKKINYSNNHNDKPSKTIEFDYNYYDKPNIPSGLGVPNSSQQSIIYQNVKVTESDKKGYTKYYYKTPFNYPTFYHPTLPNENIYPYYNFIKKGLLYKQEIYDDSNNKKQVIETDYILPEYNFSKISSDYVFGLYKGIRPPNLDGNSYYEDYGYTIYTTEQYPEKIVTKETSYDDTMNGLEVISEKTFDSETNNLKTEKRITADGTVTEAIYQYAKDKNNTKLLNANMHSIPLEVLHKTNNVEIGKIEMKFDHQDNFYPSSIRKYGLNNVINTEEKNDLYDDFGNVLQKTSKTGIPTTYIYGYNSSLLIAIIEGANYTQVMQALGLGTDKNSYKNLDIYIKSNQDVNEAKEVALQQSLDQFRLNSQLKEYLITTYTYDPFIGMRSMTTPSGNKEYYFYDNAHQLIRIEDINHNIIKEFKYKYNLQP